MYTLLFVATGLTSTINEGTACMKTHSNIARPYVVSYTVYAMYSYMYSYS